MKFLKYILLLPVAVLAFYSEAISAYLIDLGWSWTMSKWWIYILLWILPIYYIVDMRRRQQRKERFVLPVLSFVLSTTMAAFHFVEYPIYDGDIAGAGVVMQEESTIDGFEEGLLMISIPGCPYCFEATTTLKKLKERTPDLAIRQVVLSDRISDMELYKEVAEGKYEVDTTSAYSFYRTITSSYPTFVLVKDGKMQKQWRNSAFGVVAKDEIEGLVE
ncbi:plasmid transfer operon protein [Lishizhenia tianjinensis]|uniref:Plasmid transfer operon protein n=1 Tax=Lishizhenia tianjinensis TaxID=477690 RepID=A0A1I7BP00_9FLAO|nr:thioredoxin family protein [Lishizhenia tianjinensis]SFT88858.1 plasmid transfer operon protein [Lishizhenia tianjinensis]